EGWAAHGIPYPSARARLEVLEESVRVMRALWRTTGVVDHKGPRYELRGARLGATPIQPGGPPIWIAAMGPRALALTARCADGWEASYVSPASFAARWERLSVLLGAEGRTVDRFGRSIELDAIALAKGASPADAVDRFRAARRLA